MLAALSLSKGKVEGESVSPPARACPSTLLRAVSRVEPLTKNNGIEEQMNAGRC